MSTTDSLSTQGRSTGSGTFAEGTITKHGEEYHLSAASTQGERFRCYIETVYVDYNEEINMAENEKQDVSGEEFKLSTDTLHLR